MRARSAADSLRSAHREESVDTVTSDPSNTRKRQLALLLGICTHASFALGVGWMALSLATGMRAGCGPLHGGSAALANLGLALHFPLLHSFLLSRPGSRALARSAPLGLGTDLATTSYAAVASLQLVVVFGLWSPSGIVWWEPTGVLRGAWLIAYGACWLLLGKAMADAGLDVQTGAKGWLAVWRGRRPRFGPFPRHGLFRFCRQPVYLAFSLILWTGPVWGPDHLAIALVWTAYCIFGARVKERRYLAHHGESFRAYQEAVPFWLPRRRAAHDA